MIRKLLLLVKLLFTTIFTEKILTPSLKLICLGMFFVISNVNSQVANYTFSQSNGTFTAITGGTGATGIATTWDDGVTTNSIPIGFTFTFNGVNYTTCSINYDGYITFNGASANQNRTPISGNSNTYSGAISPFALDLLSGGTSDISYKTNGTAPNRTFIVEWKNVKRFNGGTKDGSLNFQIVLNETTNTVQIIYGTCTTNATDLSAEVGLRGTSNADYNNRSVTTSWASSVAGGSNAATCSNNSTRLPASGLTFTWTPVVCSFSNFGTVTQITNVKFNSIDNTSTGTTSYENFTGLTPTTTVYRDQSYSLNVKGNTGGNVNYYYTAFFDWNQDGDFLDVGEYTVIGTFRNSPATNVVASVFVKIPTTATLGNTRMRIIGHLGSYNTTPCAAVDANNVGQVEDYTITVGATCTATPTPGGTNSTANPVCSTTPFTLSLANETLGAPTYQWQTSTNGTDWVNATPSQPAFFSSDFSTPQGTNSTVGIESVSGSDAKIAGGVLILTDITDTGHQSGYFINKSLGSNVNAFTASFDYRIWTGPVDGADGMSLSYGDGFVNNNGGGENGEGNGLILKLDTYDNDQVAVGGRIRIDYGGNSIFATAIGAVVLRNANYRNITLTVDNNGYLSLSLAGTQIVSNLLLPGYTGTDKSAWKFKFSARTGGNKDQHSVDNLVIKYLDVNANNSIYTTTQTAPTYYRALVTCGLNTTPSTAVLVNMISAVIAPITASTCSGVVFNITPTGTIPTGTTYSWTIPTVTGGAGALTGGVANTGSPTSITGTLTNTTTTAQTATYTVTPTTSGCAGATFTVTVTVNPNSTVTRTSAAGTTNQAVCVNTPITTITYATTNATGATFTGLPTGVNGSWAANVITISGTPSAVATSNYTVTLTGCGNVTATGTITANPNSTVTLSSAAGTTNQAVCVNTPITTITYATTNATGATFTGLPTGVNGSWAANVITISGTPSAVATSNYTVTLTGCGNVTATGTITANPNSTVTLSSAAGTTNQAVCVNTPITTITYATTNATGATFTGLPAGVNGSWAANVITISGTPSAVATSNYTVTLTGCGNVTATGTITANPNSTVTLSSAAGTTNQSICVNTPLTTITYATTNATGATFTGLPAGVNGSWAANVITISGTPSAVATSNYTVTLTGCGNVTATGTITANPNSTVTLSSAAGTTNQSICVNTPITTITYTTTNATGATFTGLPTGVNGSWAANVITISGTPSAVATSNYTVTLTGCGNVTATGTITANPNSTVTLSSAAGTTNQSICVNTPLTTITYATTNATGATFTGLPAGVNGSWAANVITISGTPSAVATSNYTVTLTGCGNVTATGTITANPNSTVTLSSAAGTTNQAVCVNKPITNITYATTNATGATFTGLPAGVNGSWAANIITISGTPSAVATSNYTVTLTGCGNVTATGTITANPNSTVTLSSAAGTTNQAVCVNTPITNINYATTNATGATFTGLPAGVNGSWAANVITISGTPSVVATSNYTVTLTGCGNVTATGTITVNALPVITQQPQPLVICEGLNGSFNVATSASSPIYQWEYSASVLGPWTVTNAAAGVSGHTTATLSITNVPVSYSGNYVRCTVTSNGCSTISNTALLTVNPAPTAPTIGTPTDVTCTTSGSVTLTNLPAGSWTLNQTGFASRTTTGSGTSYNVTGLAAGTYRFSVSNGTCTSVVSTDAIILDQSSTTWNGTAWSNGTPDATKAAVIAGAFTVSADLTACSLTINSGISITVPSSRTLNIVNGLTVAPTASLTFDNHSALVQTNNTAGINSGKITYKRIAAQIRQADYVYWSTPVSPQRLIDVSPASSYDKFYGFNGDNWVSANVNTNMVVGKGYIIRGPNTYSNTAKADYTASFIGVPNNGTITGEAMTAGKYYLVGNPYPSALNAKKFLDDNLFLDGTLYFWTHNTPVVLSGAYRYSSTDYASYNLTGGVATSESALSGSIPGNNNAKPTGNVGAGQSFFISATTAGTVTFNNGMRLGAANNSQFFKSAATGERHRVWLNMTNAEGAFKQMLVGYVDGATNEYEKRYDGVSFDANPYVDFYSVGNGNNYVIQARALPFTATDQVPLGYRTTIAGNFKISIDEVDGDLTNQNIYLEDKKTGTINDLKAADYTFTTEKGTFADRFVLRYTNKTLGTGDFENVENGLLVSVKEKTIKVTSSAENIKEVTIYDITGKLLYNKKKVGATELQIQNLPSSNQVLLVKVTLDNDFTATKKIIFN